MKSPFQVTFACLIFNFKGIPATVSDLQWYKDKICGLVFFVLERDLGEFFTFPFTMQLQDLD